MQKLKTIKTCSSKTFFKYFISQQLLTIHYSAGSIMENVYHSSGVKTYIKQ